MNQKSINLVLPGLFQSFQQSEIDENCFPQFNLIQSFISKSNYISSSNTEIPVLSVDYYKNFPLAFYENSESLSDDSIIFYAEPISIEVKSDHIVAFPVSIDSADYHMLDNIINKFNQHFSPDGLTLKCLPSGNIVCQSSAHNLPKMTAVYSVYGRDIKHFLPQGDEAKFWLRVFNEVQMFLHEYIEEEQRVFNNQLLNGFWFWGEGNKTTVESNQGCFIGDTYWLDGFCSQNKTKRYEISDIENSNEDCIHIVDESLLRASSYGNMDSWLEGLKKIETKILTPLNQLLKRGVIREINIQDTPDSHYQLKNMHRYRFYRKNISLNEICVISE